MVCVVNLRRHLHSVPCLLINDEAVEQFCGLEKEVWEKCSPSMQEEAMIHPMVVEKGVCS